VARAAWSLPYVPSTITAAADDGPGARTWSIDRSDGTSGRVRATVGGPRPADPLDVFLTERYALYARAWWSSRRALWAPVAHEPWALRTCTDVEIDAGLVRAAGYPVGDGPVRVAAADTADVRIGLPRVL
jgi:uncharacterized protein YqjF (DUF2071 family)